MKLSICSANPLTKCNSIGPAGIFVFWLGPFLFNSIDGLIQMRECSNVISATEYADDRGQISVWNRCDIKQI